MSKAANNEIPERNSSSKDEANSVEPPLLQNTVSDGPAKSPMAAHSKSAKSAKPLKRRASDSEPQGPTIDNVRELLLGDSLKKSQKEMELIERNTVDQLGLLRDEMGSRIDRVVRALATVNQAVQKEFTAREESIRETSAELSAKSEELNTKVEDRLSFLEAKIYTVVADMERKVSEAQTADKDNLVEKLAESNRLAEEQIAELTRKVDEQLQGFSLRLASEIKEVSDSVAQAQSQAGKEAEALGSQVGQRLGAVESQLASELGELRAEVNKSAEKLRSELNTHAGAQQAALVQTQVETQRALQKHVERLEGKKVSRADFSVALQELASRLDSENKAED